MQNLKSDVKQLLKARLVRLKNWSEERATAGVNAYEQFLKLKAALKDYKATKLSPTPLIDEVWHLHVLDTQKYADDCVDFCREIIHHDVDGDINVIKREIRRNATKVAYEMQYGKEPEGEMWSFDSAASNKQSLQHRYVIGSKRPAIDSPSMIASQENCPKAMDKKIIMNLDAIKAPKFHNEIIDVSNGKTFKVQVTDDTRMNEVLKSIANYEGILNYDQWQVSLGGGTIKPSSVYERYPASGFGKWKVILPSSKKTRLKKGRKNVEINLVPSRYLCPTYFVDVQVTSNEYYRVKINKEITLQEIMDVLPKNVGRWKLSNMEASLQANNLREGSVVNLEFKAWSDEQFLVYVHNQIMEKIPIEVKRRTSTSALFNQAAATTGMGRGAFRLLYDGERLVSDATVGMYEMTHEDIIEQYQEFTGC